MNLLMARGINLFIEILIWIIIARALLSWFPNINWWSQPFKAVKEISDVILEPFKKIIPPIGGIDISPIGAFLALEILRVVIITILVR